MHRELRRLVTCSFSTLLLLFLFLMLLESHRSESPHFLLEEQPIQGEAGGQRSRSQQYALVPWRNSTRVPRVLSRKEHKQVLELLQLVATLFAQHNVQWVLFYGTLLGSYMCHDLLPWDDDVDVLIELSDLALVSAMQEHGVLASHGLKHTVANSIHKISYASGPQVGPWPWSWPSVDLIPYADAGNMLENLDFRNRQHHFYMPKEKFYPTHMRPLAWMWLPVPRDPFYLLNLTYYQDKTHSLSCRAAEFDHKRETHRAHRPTAPCHQLRKDYPFVWRNKTVKLGSKAVVTETLRLDEKELYHITVEEPFYPQANPYEWKLT